MVTVEWQDEEGTVLCRYDGPALTLQILESLPPESFCLRFIDPYGDTTFNQLQIGVLVEELSVWANTDPAPAIRHLLQFATLTQGETHTYLKFIGD